MKLHSRKKRAQGKSYGGGKRSTVSRHIKKNVTYKELKRAKVEGKGQNENGGKPHRFKAHNGCRGTPGFLGALQGVVKGGIRLKPDTRLSARFEKGTGDDGTGEEAKNQTRVKGYIPAQEK